MTTMALVLDGVVVNLIVNGPDYTPPEGMRMVPVGDAVVSIGDAYADGVFVPQGQAEQAT